MITIASLYDYALYMTALSRRLIKDLNFKRIKNGKESLRKVPYPVELAQLRTRSEELENKGRP